MIAASVTLEIVGVPAPQGSKRTFVVADKARMTDMGGTKAVAWRDSVSAAARAAADVHGQLDGPLRLDVTFRFPMPQSRPKPTRLLGCAWKSTAPDASKLLRALEDGLQAGGLLRDDCLLVEETVRKIELAHGWSGAVVKLRPVQPLLPGEHHGLSIIGESGLELLRQGIP